MIFKVDLTKKTSTTYNCCNNNLVMNFPKLSHFFIFKLTYSQIKLIKFMVGSYIMQELLSCNRIGSENTT